MGDVIALGWRHTWAICRSCYLVRHIVWTDLVPIARVPCESCGHRNLETVDVDASAVHSWTPGTGWAQTSTEPEPEDRNV